MYAAVIDGNSDVGQADAVGYVDAVHPSRADSDLSVPVEEWVRYTDGVCMVGSNEKSEGGVGVDQVVGNDERKPEVGAHSGL